MKLTFRPPTWLRCVRRPPGGHALFAVPLFASPPLAANSISQALNNSKLADKYRPLVPVLRELILRQDTPLAPDVKDMIATQLDNAEDRFAAICHDHNAEDSPNQPSSAQPSSF
jgi:hypothetical protein